VALLCAPLIAILLFFAAWPHLWIEPVKTLSLYLGWYLTWGARGEPGFQWLTSAVFLTAQTPAVILFGSVGVWVAIRGIIRNKNRETYAFILLWFALPVIRVLMPRMYNYDGVRHFIEYAIPLGALTGIGAVHIYKWLVSLLKNKAAGRALAGSLLAIPFLTWSVTMIKIHPHELVYFNFLPGGAAGVERKCHDCGLATDYWGSSYRQGIEWLNANAERDAIIVAPMAGHIVKAVQPMWMRPDLRLVVPQHKSDRFLRDLLHGVRPGEAYVMYVTRKRAYGDLIRRVDMQGKLEHAISVDGVPILKIMKSDKNDIWPQKNL